MIRPGHNRKGQKGSMAITMLLLLLGLVAMLGLVEIGYLYWAKRDAQKVADLSALAGAQRLQACTADNASNMQAYGNAVTDNRFTAGTVTITCGNWSPTNTTPNHFVPPTATAEVNAVHVLVERPVIPFLGMSGALPSVSAEAIGTGSPPLAVFSVGTTLLNFNNDSLLGGALTAIGVNLSGTSLVGYNGLAHVMITPSGLLKALGIEVPANITTGGLNELLAAQLQVRPLIDVLDAVVTVAGQDELLDANVTLLNAIKAQLGDIPLDVRLGSDGPGPTGLFAQIVAPDGAANSALTAQVDALDVIAAAVGVATGKHAVSLNATLPDLGALLKVTVNTQVIEPPAIGIGGVGATAFSAQIRTFIRITSNTSGIPLVGALLNPLLQVNIDLPIALDLVAAKATVTDLCDGTGDDGKPQATISVTAPILKMCVGKMTLADAMATPGGCDQIPGASTNQPLLGVRALNVNLLSLNTHLGIDGLVNQGSGTLSADQTRVLPEGSNPLPLGDTTSDLTNALLAALLVRTSDPTANPIDPTKTSTQIATDLWNQGSGGPTTYAARRAAAITGIQSSMGGLQGFLGNLTANVLDLLGNTLSLNIPGLLGSVGNVLGNVVGLLVDVTNGLRDGLGLGCPPALLNGFQGNANQCIADIAAALNGTTNNAGTTTPNALLGVVGFLLQALKPTLNNLGGLLSKLLDEGLGLDIGRTDVHLQSLQCSGRARLVY